MFNIFKKNNQQATSEVAKKSDQLDNAVDEQSNIESEKEKIHGKDGVCCGGCGGE
jgi:CCGSCS motif protein